MVEKLIIVTGFGPFFGHEQVNASWEAVRILPDKLELNGGTYVIEKILVPVEYDAVNKYVEEIWEKKPELVIHCGVNGGAKFIHLEKFAYNNKFCQADYSGKKPESPTVCLDSGGSCCDSISTELDIMKIVKCLSPQTTSDNGLLVCSENVGNYLCGYIYLKSLDKDRKRCLFIHVPPVNKSLTSDATSKAIYNVIVECLKQI